MQEEIILVFRKAMESGADYIFLLNNDVRLEKDVLEKVHFSHGKITGLCGMSARNCHIQEQGKNLVCRNSTLFGIPKTISQKERNSKKTGLKHAPFRACRVCYSFQKNGIAENRTF